MSIKIKSSINESTLNALPVALIIFDSNEIYFANNLAKNLLQIPKNNTKQKFTLSNLISKTQHQKLIAHINLVIRGKTIQTVELSLSDSKNSNVSIELKSNKIKHTNKWVLQSTITLVNKENKEPNNFKAKQLLENLGKIPDELIYELRFLPKPHFSYISEGVKQLAGIPSNEAYDNFEIFKNSLHEEDKKNYITSIKDYNRVRKNKSFNGTIVYRYQKSKTELIYLESKIQPLLNENKKVIGIVGRVKNITDRKKTELELQEIKEKFNLITNNSNDIISLYTYYPQEKYLYVSPNITNILGNKPEDLYNDSNFFEKRSMDFSSEFKRIDNELKRNQKKGVVKNYSYRYKTKHKNGTILWLENSLTPILDANNKIIYYLNIYRNITEQQIKESELEQEKKNYQNLLDITPLAYLIHDKGKFLFGNISLIKMLGIKNQNELIGKSMVDFLIPESKSIAEQRAKQIQKSEKNLAGVNYYTLINKNNKKIQVETVTTKIEFNHQNCYLTLIKNITLEKELEQARIKTEAALLSNQNLQAEIAKRNQTQLQLSKTTAQLTSIFESTNHLMWTVNKNLQITSFNNNYSTLVKKLYNHKVKVGDVITHAIKEEERKKEFLRIWTIHLNKAFNGEKVEFTRINKLINLAHKIYLFPIYDAQKNVSEISCLGIDITKEISIQEELVKQSSKLNAIFESGQQSMWTINKKFEITSHNKNYIAAIKLSHNFDIDSKSKKTYIDPIINEPESKSKSIWLSNYEKAFSGKSLEFISERITQDSRQLIRQIYLHPIFDNNGQVVEVSGICYDITDRKKADQKLLNQAAKLNSIFDSSHHYVWTIDQDHKLTSFNKNYFDLIENMYNTLPYVGLKLDRGVLNNDMHYTHLLNEHYSRAFSGNSTTFEVESIDKKLNRIYLQVFLNPIYSEEQNTIKEVSGIAHNITEKKLIQQNIEQSLKEKEILLKEVHHRVKNNMQVISSILNLQSSYSTDPNTISILKESQNRIKTMAYIHESLYQNKTFTSVNFSEYINTLANNIIQSYSIKENEIKLNLEIEKINLTLDNSIPAGLIINELLSNAIKHAFLPNTKGEILVSLKTLNKMVYLSVIDTGQGFSSMVDFYNSPSLGLQLVNTLVEQLDGQIKFESKQGQGTKIFISFSM